MIPDDAIVVRDGRRMSTGSTGIEVHALRRSEEVASAGVGPA